jgi:uncharacterized protein (TIGR00255 family)
MTGYGEASEQVGGVFYAVEIRSLNNRFFKAAIRLPETIGALEADIEAQLRRRLGRGSITLTGVVRDPSASAAMGINDAALLTYLGHLETLHARFADKQQAVSIDLTALLALPGVLQPGDLEAVLRQARPVLQRVTDAACDKLLAMRTTEGRLIADDLSRQRQVIRERMETIRARAPQVIEEYHQRLRTRIDELMQRSQLTLDQKDLVREVAIFAERADIAEEVSRLASHLGQLETMTAEDNREPAGRTVEFLAQEMLREANTIASKSNDATISRAIVEIKGSIDRIKEQAQNIE